MDRKNSNNKFLIKFCTCIKNLYYTLCIHYSYFHNNSYKISRISHIFYPSLHNLKYLLDKKVYISQNTNNQFKSKLSISFQRLLYKICKKSDTYSKNFILESNFQSKLYTNFLYFQNISDKISGIIHKY